MSVCKFLRELFEHGRVAVAQPATRAELVEETAEARQLLEDRANVVALSLAFSAGTTPQVPLDLDVAHWAARQFYRASQCVVYRELDGEAMRKVLSEPCPSAPPASQHFSADLTFAFMPDLWRISSAASEQDPLVEQLREWAIVWPLSSVGIPRIDPRHVDELLADNTLLQLYVDRILKKQDWSRMKDQNVLAAARRSVGAYIDEWPQLAALVSAANPTT